MSKLRQAFHMLQPSLPELRHRHPGIGPGDEFCLLQDLLHDNLIGTYHNKMLDMRERAVVLEGWDAFNTQEMIRKYIANMLALVDKVYARVSVARLVDQATVHLRRPGVYRPGCYRPAQKPRLVRSNPLLEKINVRMAA